MRNKKLLFILIPLIIVILVLVAGYIYLTLNSTPEAIFKTSIKNVFSMFERKQDEYETLKGTINISGNVESDDENVVELNEYLEKLNLGINMQADTNNFIINENIDISYDNQSMLNATMILQDQKGYLYLKDWLDKYLELPEDLLDYSEIIQLQDKLKTLDINSIIKTVEQELVKEISKQDLTRGKATINLNGKEIKVITSNLNLKGEAIVNFSKEFVENLKKNETFQNALGNYKQDILTAMDEIDFNTEDFDNDAEMAFTIYTKGLFNEFVGISAKSIDHYNEDTIAMDIFYNEGRFELSNYTIYDNEREDNINLVVENKKESEDKGTATITIGVADEKLTIVYNYRKQGDTTVFDVSTQINGIEFTVTGNYQGNDKNTRGNLTLSFTIQETTKINLTCDYNLTYGEQVQKTDVQNAVLINELSEEDQEELMNNIENSPLYTFIQLMNLLDDDTSLFVNDKPEVSLDGYTVKYNVPDNFTTSSYNTEDRKMYTDENFNSVNVYIEEERIDKFLDDLEDEYVLTSGLYKNQNISEKKTYPANGIEYQYRTITYSDEYSNYVNLYFAYQLDNNYCYVVEIETENGNISMENMNKFLDITL